MLWQTQQEVEAFRFRLGCTRLAWWKQCIGGQDSWAGTLGIELAAWTGSNHHELLIRSLSQIRERRGVTVGLKLCCPKLFPSLCIERSETAIGRRSNKDDPPCSDNGPAQVIDTRLRDALRLQGVPYSQPHLPCDLAFA